MKPKGQVMTFNEKMSAKYGIGWDIALGIGGALLAALVYVALFACVMKIGKFKSSDQTITIINEVAKVLCMLLGAWISVRRNPCKGWLRGGLTGMLYVIFAFLLFSIIDGNWQISWAFASDLLLGAAVGGIGGIIFVNFRKKK